ncbi:MAG: HEPN domain-containing protein [Planctomycetes bacterium]|nr:HEPN domain-containing protein [Planctomycetota bacterium]
MKPLTADWIKKAERDFRVGRKLARSQPAENDFVCFCSQQSAEKFLKALLVEQGLSVPRTHNLEDLLNLLRPYHAALWSLRRGMVFLSRFAVDTRYPGFEAKRSQAKAAMRWATRVREAVRAVLGIRPKTQRRKKT